MEGSYRVTQVHRDRYQVKNGTEELYCVLTGSLRYREEYPVAGDFVEITVNPYGDSLIRSILPRRTAFSVRTGAATRTDLPRTCRSSRWWRTLIMSLSLPL